MSRRVLLIDEDEDFRVLLGSALAARGLEVLEASSLDSADEPLQRGGVDVVVVDASMPDVVTHLRARGKSLCIVCVSSIFSDIKSFRSLTTDLNVSLVAYKPIDATDFAEKVVRLFGKSQPSLPETPGALVSLLEVRKQFGARLMGRLEELERAVEKAKEDLSHLEELAKLTHRLRGSAGSYGFSSVSEAVGNMEDLLASARAPGAKLPRFFFESVQGALREAQLAAAHAIEARESGDDLPTRALLVVDDDPIVLHLAKAAGRRMAVSVITAQSSDEALQRASSQALVGAILDVHLDNEESFALARKIRETKANADIPIAFASADVRLETRVQAIEAGGLRFFEKPISDEFLCLLLQEFLSLSQARQGRLLIVDDDHEVLAQYSRHLTGAGYAVETLSSEELLIERLEATRPDVLILDVNLPRISGIDVLRALRASDRWESLPILVVTGATDAETRLKAFRAGASDVVTKPVVREELLARVGVQAERMRLTRERSDKDALSGLLLRRAFIEAFQRALASCARDKKPLAIAMIDIDHFKRINDGQGHLAGDQVIARFGEFLRRRFRVEDLRGRWGGEEFLLAFPGASRDFATQATRRLLAEFSQMRFSGTTETFGASFTAGIAAFPDDGTSMSTLIRRADELLYLGKRQGRSRVIDGENDATADGA